MEHSKKPDPQVGEALRSWRGERSLREVAELAGISTSYWQDLERGEKEPGLGIAHTIERLTGIPSDRWLSPYERERIKLSSQRSAQAALDDEHPPIPLDIQAGAGV